MVLENLFSIIIEIKLIQLKLCEQGNAKIWVYPYNSRTGEDERKFDGGKIFNGMESSPS